MLVYSLILRIVMASYSKDPVALAKPKVSNNLLGAWLNIVLFLIAPTKSTFRLLTSYFLDSAIQPVGYVLTKSTD